MWYSFPGRQSMSSFPYVATIIIFFLFYQWYTLYETIRRRITLKFCSYKLNQKINVEARHVRSEVSPTEHAIRRRFVRIIMPSEFGRHSPLNSRQTGTSGYLLTVTSTLEWRLGLGISVIGNCIFWTGKSFSVRYSLSSIIIIICSFFIRPSAEHMSSLWRWFRP